MAGAHAERVAIATATFVAGLVVLALLARAVGWRQALGGLLTRGDSRRWLIGCLAVAFVLRAGPTVVAPVLPALGDDPMAYHRLATALAAGEGYSRDGRPTVYRPIGYPLFLAVACRLDGLRLAGLMQATAATSLVWLALLLARSMRLPLAAHRGAMLLVALSPEQIAYGQLLYSEPLATALIAGAVIAWLRLLHSPQRLRWAAAAGLLLGLATLVRPSAGLAMVALVAAGLICHRVTARHLAAAGVCALVLAATWAPWVARNAVVFGRPIILPSSGAVNVYIGNNPGATGRAGGSSYVNDLLSSTDPMLWPARSLSASWEFVRSQPRRALSLALQKVPFLWADGRFGARQLYVHRPGLGETGYVGLVLVSQIFRAVVLGGALLAAWGLARRGGQAGWFALLLVTLWTLLHCVTAATGRYAAPAMVLLMPLAAWWLAGAAPEHSRCEAGEPE